jgi:hypothetical protein
LHSHVWMIKVNFKCKPESLIISGNIKITSVSSVNEQFGFYNITKHTLDVIKILKY